MLKLDKRNPCGYDAYVFKKWEDSKRVTKRKKGRVRDAAKVRH